MAMYSAGGYFETVYDHEEYRINWEIKNFARLISKIVPQKIGLEREGLEELKHCFQIGENIGCVTKWKLFLSYELGRGREVWITLNAEHSPDGHNQYGKRLYAKLEIEDAEGCTLFRTKSSTVFYANRNFRALMKIRLFKCFDEGAKQRLRDNQGNIMFAIRMELSTCSYENNIGGIPQIEEEHRQRILRNIAEQIPSGDDPDDAFDVRIRIIGSNTIVRAHRVYLSARSPEFAKMFRSGMKEATTGLIEIEDLSELAVNVILHFVYTGSLRADWGQVVGEVVCGADKYQLSGLTGLANHAMMSLCTADNAEELLDIASMFDGFAKAKSGIKDYMEKGRKRQRIE